MVGFSRHMERDEAGAFQRLRGIRERIVDPKIAEYGGRVVKTAGDGMLLEFGWVLLVMDVCTRRLVGFGVERAY